MVRLSKPKHVRVTARTHEGAKADVVDDFEALKRSVQNCLLWEDEFYEDGIDIATRIDTLVGKVLFSGDPFAVAKIAKLAVSTRKEGNLRHVPLLLLCALARRNRATRWIVSGVLSRADEPGELLAIWRKVAVNVAPVSKVAPIPAAFKKGIEDFLKTQTPYQLAKYATNRRAVFRLRDVLRLTHPKPTSEQVEVFKQIIDDSVKQVDTWESELSAGGDKCEVFTRLLQEGKLGYMALLRNLRGMLEAGVNTQLIIAAIKARKGGAEKVLPMRFLSARKAIKGMNWSLSVEEALEQAMAATVMEGPLLPGCTGILVDRSGSMCSSLSRHSDLARYEVACTLAAICPSTQRRYWVFGTNCLEVGTMQGVTHPIAFANSLREFPGVNSCSTALGHALDVIADAVDTMKPTKRRLKKTAVLDRLIVITDEQSLDNIENATRRLLSINPKMRLYIINVASAEYGIKTAGQWVRLSGYSPSVWRWILEVEGISSFFDASPCVMQGRVVSTRSEDSVVTLTVDDMTEFDYPINWEASDG